MTVYPELTLDQIFYKNSRSTKAVNWDKPSPRPLVWIASRLSPTTAILVQQWTGVGNRERITFLGWQWC